jgi:chemotaxis methyl-accepting protein methylase
MWKFLTRSGPGQRLRWRIASLRGDRKNYNYTQFHRVPTQMSLLAGPLLEALHGEGWRPPLRIANAACSTGAEPYTIASTLSALRPDLDFSILAFDVHEESLAKARRGRYSESEVRDHKLVTDEFVERTFDAAGDELVVKDGLRGRIEFARADITDPTLSERLGRFDVVLCQNLLFNFAPRIARRMFSGAASLVAAPGALFIDGVDLPLRSRLTRRAGLAPYTERLRDAHEEARVVRASGWPWHYWGLEPFDADRRDRDRRYATIFLNGFDETSRP